MFQKAVNLSVCVISLLLGCVIYAFLGDGTYIANKINEVVSIEVVPISAGMNIVRNYLADYLWGLALSCGLLVVFDEGKKNVIASISLAVGCGILWEILQNMEKVGGTGDILDVIAYLFAGATAILINLKELKK